MAQIQEDFKVGDKVTIAVDAPTGHAHLWCFHWKPGAILNVTDAYEGNVDGRIRVELVDKDDIIDDQPDSQNLGYCYVNPEWVKSVFVSDGKPLFSVSHNDFVFDKVPVGEAFTAPGMVWGSSYASILVDLPTTIVRPRLWHRLAMLREKRIERRYNR